MHRWIAKILLILLLVSIFAPVAMAVDGPPQHACCLRASHSNKTTITAMQQSDGNCCPPVATSHWAQVDPENNFRTVLAVQIAPLAPDTWAHHLLISSSYSGRAPPAFSIA